MERHPFSPSQKKRLESSRIDCLKMNPFVEGPSGIAQVILAPILTQLAIGSCQEIPLPLWKSAMISASVFLAVLCKVYWGAIRRWIDGVSTSTTSALSNVASNPTLSRIRTSVNASSRGLLSMATKCATHCAGKEKRLTLSASHPFLSAQDTEKLSLSDLSEVFRFTTTLTTPITSKPIRETAEFSPRLQDVFDTLECAIAFSRGKGVGISQSLSSSVSSPSFGDTDALAFIAASRIFVEWRTLLLIPDGYPRYAMGMRLAHRDLLQNIAKMEQGVHRYLEHIDKFGNTKRTSPSIRELLQFEIDQNMHRRLPKLIDQSGANGFLWTIRQIRYQTRIFANFANIPKAFPDGKAANVAAYQATYGRYHNFFTRQVFQASFDAAPEASVIFQKLSVATGEDVSRATQSFSEDDTDSEDSIEQETWIHLDLDGSESYADDLLDNESPTVDILVELDSNPLEQFGKHIASEWLKLTRFLQSCSGVQSSFDASRNIMSPLRPFLAPHKTTDQETICFVDFMSLLLDELEGLVTELNLNDPSRV